MTKLDSRPPSHQLQPGDEQVLPLEFLRVGWGVWHKNLSSVNEPSVYNAQTQTALLCDKNVVNSTIRFLRHWSMPMSDSNERFDLVRGLFGAWIPGHMKAAKQGLQSRFANVSIIKTVANGTTSINCTAISAHLDGARKQGKKSHLLCHSKGGLETLLAISREPRLAKTVLSLTLVQTARQPSPVLTHWLEQPKYRIYPALFQLVKGRGACEELCEPQLAKLVTECDRAVRLLIDSNIPVISVASSTSIASKSLETQHALMQRLFQDAPGAQVPLHDGLFETRSLMWHQQHSQVRQIYLSNLDHSQPGVGGAGFDPSKFWLALAGNAIENCGLEYSIE
jgi:hypothetical protein